MQQAMATVVPSSIDFGLPITLVVQVMYLIWCVCLSVCSDNYFLTR